MSATEPLGQNVQQLGNYELGERVGSGGMGTVYRATDRRTQTTVAVKVIHPHLQIDDAYVERFRREAHIASLLTSPYAARVIEFGADKGRYFLALEFVEGVKLGQTLGQGQIEPVQALAIAVQVALALDAAEARGVVHRDIKPDNIIITPDGSVKVTDFGIARLNGVQGVTATGVFLGSLDFAAPERFASGEPDIRSDIYSLGIVLFQMLEGDLPFKAANPTRLVSLHEAMPAPLEQLARLPSVVVDVVARCLEKDASLRYQHVSELVAALNRARLSVTGAATETWATEATGRLYETSLLAPPAPPVSVEIARPWRSGKPPAGVRPDGLGGRRMSVARRVLSVAPIVAAVAGFALVFFLRGGSSASGDRVNAVLAIERTARPAATPEAAATVPSGAGSAAPPKVPAGVYQYRLNVIENTCPSPKEGTAVGTSATFAYELRAGRQAAPGDGFLSPGEPAEVHSGAQLLGSYVFTYPRFDFTYTFEGGRIVVHMQFENGALATASQEQYYDRCYYSLVQAPVS